MTLDPVALVELLNEIGGRNAIGRIDLVENRFVGIKSRGCYETPGGTLLVAAHRELEALCLERDVMHFKQHMGLKYAELVYFGLWFTPLREALDAFVESTQQDMTGTITLVALQGQRVGGEPSVGELALSHRSVVVHHGRQLRPERRGRIHSHSRTAFALAGPDAHRRWRDEDVVGPLSAASRPGFRALAAVLRLRPAAAVPGSGGQPGPRSCLEERRCSFFERADCHSRRPGADCAEGGYGAGVSRGRRSRGCSSLRRETAGRADRRHGLQTAQRTQPQRADRHRSASVCSG